MPHSDHKPWKDVTKDLLRDDLPRKLHRLVAWLDEIQLDLTVVWSQHAGRNLDDPGEGLGSQIAPMPFGPWPAKNPRSSLPRNVPVNGWFFRSRTLSP